MQWSTDGQVNVLCLSEISVLPIYRPRIDGILDWPERGPTREHCNRAHATAGASSDCATRPRAENTIRLKTGDRNKTFNRRYCSRRSYLPATVRAYKRARRTH